MSDEPDLRAETSNLDNNVLDPDFDDFTFEPDPRWNHHDENI